MINIMQIEMQVLMTMMLLMMIFELVMISRRRTIIMRG